MNKESTVSEVVVNDASLMTENEMDLDTGELHLTAETPTTTETSATDTITSTTTTETSATVEDEVDGLIDLGVVIREANGSWDKLRSLVQHLLDDKKKQYLSHHFKPSHGNTLHSHPVTQRKVEPLSSSTGY